MDCFSGLWRPLGTDMKQRCCVSALAEREQPGGDTDEVRGAQAVLESVPQSGFFSSVQGMCNCLILSTQECENTNNWLSLSAMGELCLRN